MTRNQWYGESQKKGISGILIGLVALVIILGISNTYFYTSMQSQINILYTDKISLQNQVTTLTSQKNELNTTHQTYVSTHSHTDIEYNNLDSSYTSYVTTHSYNNTQYSSLNDTRYSLQNQVDILNAPKLVYVDLVSIDSSSDLQVIGHVCNVGNGTAPDSKLRVIGFISGEVKAIDTYILLGTILAEGWVSVDSTIAYTGGPLENLVIIPEWS